MPTHDEDTVGTLADLLKRPEQQHGTSSEQPTLWIPYYKDITPALDALHSMTSNYWDCDRYYNFAPTTLKRGIKTGRQRYQLEHPAHDGTKRGIKTGRLRYQLQHGRGTMSVAQLTGKILDLESEKLVEERRREFPRYADPLDDHSPINLERIERELGALKRVLLSRLIREQEAEEAEILKGMAELETEIFGQLPPPPAEPPPGEILTETIVIAPGAPGRN